MQAGEGVICHICFLSDNLTATHEHCARLLIVDSSLFGLVVGALAECQAILKGLLCSLPIACLRSYHPQYAINRSAIVHKAPHRADPLDIGSSSFTCLNVQVPLCEDGDIKIARQSWRFWDGGCLVELFLRSFPATGHC